MVVEDVQVVTDAHFEAQVLEAPVLVDFWAEWCGPCGRLAPTVDAVASELRGKLKVGKVNVDENPGAARRFNVRGIPTLTLFKEARVVEVVVGLVDKKHLTQIIAPHLR